MYDLVEGNNIKKMVNRALKVQVDIICETLGTLKA